MPFDSYTVEPNGAHVFVDSGNGERVTLAPTPSVLAHAKRIEDDGLRYEAAKQASEVPPLPALSATSGSTMDRGAGAPLSTARLAADEVIAPGSSVVQVSAPRPPQAPPAGPPGPAVVAPPAKSMMQVSQEAAPPLNAAGNALVAGVKGAGGAPETVPPKPAAGAPGGAPLIRYEPPPAAPTGAAGHPPDAFSIQALAEHQKLLDQMRRAGGRYAATPEREQRHGYTEQTVAGPADEITERMEEKEIGPPEYVPKTFKAEVDPKTLAVLVDVPRARMGPAPRTEAEWAAVSVPGNIRTQAEAERWWNSPEHAAQVGWEQAGAPPGLRTESARKQWWYTKLAREASEGGLSIGSLRAQYGAAPPMGAPPKGTREPNAWYAAKAAEGEQLALAADQAMHGQRIAFDRDEGARYREHQARVEQYGPKGQAGEREHELRQAARKDEFEAEKAGEIGNVDKDALERQAGLDLKLADDLRAINGEMRRVQGEIEAGEIDPKRWWKSKSTGEKIAAGIGIMLAGIGGEASLHHHMGRIDKEIDRDIDAQRAAIGAKNQKLTGLQQIYQNLIAAGASDRAATEGMRRAATLGLEQEIRQNAALTGSDLKHRQADRAIAAMRALQDQRDAAISAGRRGTRATQVAVIPARAGGYAGPNQKQIAAQAEHEAELNQKLGKGAADITETYAKAEQPGGKAPERFVMDGTTYRAMNATSPAEGHELRKRFAAVDTLSGILTEIEKLGPVDKLSPFESSRVKSLVNQYVSQEQKMLGEGVTRESDVARGNDILASVRAGKDVTRDLRKIHADIKEFNARQAGAVPVR